MNLSFIGVSVHTCEHMVFVYFPHLINHWALQLLIGTQSDAVPNQATESTTLSLCHPRQHETVIPGDLPLIQEVTTTLREWSTIWRQLYVVRNGMLGYHLKRVLLFPPWEPGEGSLWGRVLLLKQHIIVLTAVGNPVAFDLCCTGMQLAHCI